MYMKCPLHPPLTRLLHTRGGYIEGSYQIFKIHKYREHSNALYNSATTSTLLYLLKRGVDNNHIVNTARHCIYTILSDVTFDSRADRTDS